MTGVLMLGKEIVTVALESVAEEIITVLGWTTK